MDTVTSKQANAACYVFMFFGFICGCILGFPLGYSCKVREIPSKSDVVAAPSTELIKTTLDTESVPDPEPIKEPPAAVPESSPSLAKGFHRYPIEKVVRVVDGDTMDVRFYSWEDTILVKRLRLLGVDTPELRPRKGTAMEKAAEKQAAYAALVFVEQAVKNADSLYLITDWKSDSFGRVLADIEYKDNSGTHYLGEELLKSGHAKPYKK